MFIPGLFNLRDKVFDQRTIINGLGVQSLLFTGGDLG